MQPRDQDLPDHSVRESRRTVHVHLRFSLHAGLEVVVPPGFDRAEIPALLRQKRHWIERTRRELDTQRLLLDSRPHDEIPESIELRAMGETWTVEARPTEAGRVSVREPDAGRLVITGPARDAERWRALLKRWVTQKARRHLVACAECEARAYTLHYGAVSIRWQKSRWGSCSRRSPGNGRSAPPRLSLNAGLLFLPPHLVRYVILHELCHTERMDHSPAFWKQLESMEPAARAIREELRSAWHYIPSWLEARAPSNLPVDGEDRQA